MKSRYLGLLAAIALLGVWAAYRHLSVRRRAESVLRSHALGPIPETADDVRVSFKESFPDCDMAVSFSDSPQAIRQWAQQSPGLGPPIPRLKRPNSHEISPHDSQGGTAVVDEATGTVLVELSFDECP